VPIYGITMPIIIRKGSSRSPRARQSRDRAAARGALFLVDITRSGSASVFGDLLVLPQGDAEPAFVARGIGVYPEIERATRHLACRPSRRRRCADPCGSSCATRSRRAAR
jgi:hypothetical protein